MNYSLNRLMYDPTVTREDMAVAMLRQWRHTSDVVDRATEVVLARHGLNETAAAVLMILGEPESSPTMRDLARLLGCDPSNVTLVAAKLQNDAMIDKRPHPTDGRSRVLALTPRGQAELSQLLIELTAASPLNGLSVAEQQQLSALLHRVMVASPLMA